MLNLALWLKKNGFRADQVQAFYPSPMATATAMFHTDKNPLKKVTYKSEPVESVKDPEQRKLHKAFLRYHDPNNWPLLRKVLRQMGREDLIGDGKHQLIPGEQSEEQKTYTGTTAQEYRERSSTPHQGQEDPHPAHRPAATVYPIIAGYKKGASAPVDTPAGADCLYSAINRVHPRSGTHCNPGLNALHQARQKMAAA